MVLNTPSTQVGAAESDVFIDSHVTLGGGDNAALYAMRMTGTVLVPAVTLVGLAFKYRRFPRLSHSPLLSGLFLNLGRPSSLENSPVHVYAFVFFVVDNLFDSIGSLCYHVSTSDAGSHSS